MKISLTKQRLLLLILTLSGIASAPLQLVSGRDRVDEAMRMYGDTLGSTTNFTLLSRFFNLALATLIVLVIKKTLARKIYLTPDVGRLLASLAAYLILNYWLGSLFGSYPGLPSLYPFFTALVLMVFCLIKDTPPLLLLNGFRYVATIMILGSLLSSFVFPNWAYMAEASYSFGETTSKRLIGLFQHPSVLGLYVLMLLIVELQNRKNDTLRLLNLVVCPIVLVMTLSKTAIILAAAIFIWRMAKKGIGGLMVIGALAFGGIAALLRFSSITSMFKENENFATLTGRTEIWKYILDSWVKNPLFGNGPDFFGSLGSVKISHAHNIIIQAISDGGILGLLGLFFYLYSLLKIAYDNRKTSESLSILLTSSLLLFSLTEPVIRMDSFLSGLFFINAFLILYLCALDRYRKDEEAEISKNNVFGQYGYVLHYRSK